MTLTMGTGTESILSGLRRPEYTGENRCTPCTVVNVAIALALGAGFWFVAPWLAPVALGLSLAAIYLRGYLVPGTPTLTERYFPDRVLRWFDEAPGEADTPLVGAGADGEFDPEPILLDADVLEVTADGNDLRLTDEFRSAWRKRIEVVRESGYEPRIARLLGAGGVTDPSTIEIRYDDRRVAVLDDDATVGMWPSEAALVADVAAVPVLRERIPGWDERDPPVRGRLLHSLRVFLEGCPICGGELSLAEETLESCCRSAEVVTLTCRSCDAPILEVEA